MLKGKKEILLGEALIKKGLVTLEHVQEALKKQNQAGGYLGEALLRLGHVKEHDLFEVLSEQLGIPYMKSLKNMAIPPLVMEKIPAKLASHYHFLPVSLQRNTLTICVSNPLDQHHFEEIRALTGFHIEVVMMSDGKSIEEAIKENYGIGAQVLERINAAGETANRPTPTVAIDTIDNQSDDASMIELVNHIMTDAMKAGASDIHIEPYQDQLDIRYRVDGMLQPARIPPNLKNFRSNFISRIKIMSKLDIAEKRLPQDGQVIVKTKAGEMDLRVSVIPCQYGEAVMIRILRPHMLMNLDQLEFSSYHLKIVEKIIQKPSGIILVTGPTGSGKTTTLYAFLKKLNTPERKIITIEDPIEYYMKGILQIQTHAKIGLTFDASLRHVLRHDPDVMMVGEIRDVETAKMASRAALTGHLLLSTLHTRDSVATVARLVDMGVEPFLVASAVEAVIAQRLVRKICSQCKVPIQKEKHEWYQRIPQEYKAAEFYEGKGCEKCLKTGFSGRMAIHEIFIIDDNMRRLIVTRAQEEALRDEAIKKGLKTLWHDGIEKVAQGLTTLGEVFRVCTERTG